MSKEALVSAVKTIVGLAKAGNLDDALGRAATLQRESFRERTLWATRIAAGTCLAIAMGFAAWTILDLGRAYVGQIEAVSRELDG